MQGIDFLQGDVSVTTHGGDDDVLSAGLGLAGLKGPLAPFGDPQRPMAQELRRRAIRSAVMAPSTARFQTCLGANIKRSQRSPAPTRRIVCCCRCRMVSTRRIAVWW